ncbi:MAG: T9SS type A sorting domain-containing protein [Bacteroidia bacterium]
MRKLFFLLFLFFCSPAKAQHTFEKVIDTLGCVSALCIQETFDGGYIFGGTSSYNGNDAIVVKLDSSGTIEWAKTYFGAGAEGVMYLEQTSDSGYMLNVQDVTNAKTCLYRLNNIGDTLWTKSYSAGVGSTSAVLPNSMASVYNNNVFGLTGYYSNGGWPSTFFIAVLSNGLLLNSKVYNTAVFGNESNAINKTFDGGFIMTGSISNTSSFADVYLIRTNTYGDTLWTRHYDKSQTDAGQAVIQTIDSGFAIAAYVYNGQYNDIYLIKTDSIGDTLWTKTYNFYSDQGPYTIQQTSDGGYIIVGSVVDISLGARKVYLIKTNPTGDTLWTRIYGGVPWTSQGYFVRQTKDGGYIISGITGNFGTGTYIIKTDSMGLLNTITGNAEINNAFEFSIYPIPSTGIINIHIKGVQKSNVTLEILNVLNQCVYAGEINAKESLVINLENVQSGQYVARLRTNEGEVSRKFLIEKNR